jgi:protoheme IX farnesyltransferase
VYGLLILPFNGRLLQMVERLAAEPNNRDRAKGLFRWSILYLFGICLLLVMSRMSGSAQFDLQVRAVVDILAGGFLPVAS